ncbi:NUDIX domain-containing protein [Yinghuangia seranimata]|uniref:NUDIX domain-containing protein n=1 Tax=Yinghuangia seranimata TaxID=408067 RepID=UPI00248BD65D|nr:NUDIX hydrolase [Yinghuangia seranimata]MDI2131309.1 NUDIX hydrolase [Yinghuangia seranimata]
MQPPAPDADDHDRTRVVRRGSFAELVAADEPDEAGLFGELWPVRQYRGQAVTAAADPPPRAPVATPAGVAATGSRDRQLLPHEAWLATLPLHYTSAAVLLTDEDGRVLLLKASYREGWLLPGGCLDHDEDPATCASRELEEETGLRLSVGALLDVDWRPQDPDGDGRMAAPVLQFVFDAGTIPADTAVRLDAESVDWRWASLDEAAALQGPAGYERLRRAYRARTTGRPGYGVSARGAID